MGPQPFGCGRIVTWPCLFITRWLQWGRNLSVAEGATVRALRKAAAGFNGAATFRLRKASLVFETWTCFRLQWGRNLSVAEGWRGRAAGGRLKRFNGAATFRLRKERIGCHMAESHACFNGAATFRLRKGPVNVPRP